MFTGIIECVGRLVDLEKKAGNLNLVVSSPISGQLKIDQSVSHNGVCLTVVGVNEKENRHTVTAIDETLQKTNLGYLEIGAEINLERCTKIGDRLDGHIVQGHVDQTAECIAVETVGGSAEQTDSYIFTFRYKPSLQNIVVEKGSICVNGISLTAFNAKKDSFSVAIIPYTWEHTNIKHIQKGHIVNLEFDIVGKYIARIIELRGGAA